MKTSTNVFIALLSIFLPLAGLSSPIITAISIPVGSQALTGSAPGLDNIWSVSSPIDVTKGIGVLVNPVWGTVEDYHEVPLHQNDHNYHTPPPYIAPYLPDPTANIIHYSFSEGVEVSGVRIVQHLNGITQVSGMIGDSLGAMTSLGTIFGPSGDVTGVYVVPDDFTIQDFLFPDLGLAGTEFTLTITKTSFFDAYAAYRIFPLDPFGNPILTTSPASSVPDNGCTRGLLFLGLLLLYMGVRVFPNAKSRV